MNCLAYLNLNQPNAVMVSHHLMVDLLLLHTVEFQVLNLYLSPLAQTGNEKIKFNETAFEEREHLILFKNSLYKYHYQPLRFQREV